MRFVKNIFVASILLAALGSFWSCNKDESNLSEAVLASASTLDFEVTGTSEKMITVYADADWVAEVPAWVTVTPNRGSGTMDVVVSVSDNLRDGTPDNPRKAALVFGGRSLASRTEVLIIQGGDKYRDVKEYKVDEIPALKDEAVLSLPNVVVMAVTTEGFIVTDALKSGNLYVLNKTKVNIGDQISIKGSKSTDPQEFAYVNCDNLQIVSTGGTVTYPEPKDITDQIDSYTSALREFISVSGILKGNNLTVGDARYSVNIVDAPASMGVAALNGHRITVKGYFDGLAKPVHKIIATAIEDKGVAKTIFFSEDFEWLDPWSVAGGAGRAVDDNNHEAAAPQIVSPKVDGVSSLDALLSKGYEFLRVTTKTAGECIYLQRNYLKFGKTSYQAGIVLPKIENIPASAALVMSFDWCPMRQGSGAIDPVNLIVIITNGANEMTFDIPESGFANGHKLEWIKAEVELTGVQITKDTKVTIRQTQWPEATANRWFLDNVEIFEVQE